MPAPWRRGWGSQPSESRGAQPGCEPWRGRGVALPTASRAPKQRAASDLTEKAIRRGAFRSVPDLVAAIEAYAVERNADPKPFV